MTVESCLNWVFLPLALTDFTDTVWEICPQSQVRSRTAVLLRQHRRSGPDSRLDWGVVLQTERMTGVHLLTRNLLESLDSLTGYTMSSASITAASGLTTAITTSNTGPPVTAGITSPPSQVS